MAGRRREPLGLERIATFLASGVTHTVGGRLVGSPTITQTGIAARSTGRGLSGVIGGRRHWSGIIKPDGEAPAGSYQLPHVPVDQPYWPHVEAGKSRQDHGVDWDINGRTLTILPGMGLRADEDLWVQYDYLGTIPATPVGQGGVVATAGSTSFDPGTLDVFTPLPGVVEPGDLIVLATAAPLATAPAGFTERYRAGQSAVFTKTAVGGETSVTYNGEFSQGFGSGVVAVLRGYSYQGVTATTTSSTSPLAMPTPAANAGDLCLMIAQSFTAPASVSLVDFAWSPEVGALITNRDTTDQDNRRAQLIGTLFPVESGAIPGTSFIFPDGSSPRGIVVRLTADA